MDTRCWNYVVREIGMNMMMLLLGGSNTPPKTYADFLTHINGLGGSFLAGADTFTGVASSTSLLCHTLSNSGSMYGSTQATQLTNDSHVNRAIQHALPSETVFFDHIGNGLRVRITVTITAASVFPSVTRNGYTSISYSTTYTCVQITNILYWDYTLGKARSGNPYANTAHVDYIF